MVLKEECSEAVFLISKKECSERDFFMFRERFLLSKKEKNVESFRQTPRSSKAKQSLILLVIKFD